MNRLLGLVATALMALTATGCAVSSSTLVRPDQGGSQVIYRISEEQAFTTALEAYAVLTPKQSVEVARNSLGWRSSIWSDVLA